MIHDIKNNNEKKKMKCSKNNMPCIIAKPVEEKHHSPFACPDRIHFMEYKKREVGP
jgi:hypothetical protein